jgi:hypothetical protein
MKNFNTLFVIILTAASCQAQPQSEVPTAASSNSFNEYWYSGKAEIASYDLEQSRYGEVHQGHAVLIFVTEDFSKSKQVKLDNPQRSLKDKVGVLKLNFTKKFNTGIYPYSMMQSTFTPIDRSGYPNSLKTTMSSQEWCGHTFTQLNLKDDNYDVKTYSYFEQEGDKQLAVNKTLLEDEIWNLIRLNYKNLPVGSIEIIPGIFHSRLLHKPLQSATANASIEEEDGKITYLLDYKKDKRSLSITFDKSFPNKILSWKETTKGLGGKVLTTKATLKKTLHKDYWNKNNKKDTYLRDSLGLE